MTELLASSGATFIVMAAIVAFMVRAIRRRDGYITVIVHVLRESEKHNHEVHQFVYESIEKITSVLYVNKEITKSLVYETQRKGSNESILIGRLEHGLQEIEEMRKAIAELPLYKLPSDWPNMDQEESAS